MKKGEHQPPMGDDEAERLYRTMVREMYEGCVRRGDVAGAASLANQDDVVARLMEIRRERIRRTGS